MLIGLPDTWPETVMLPSKFLIVTAPVSFTTSPWMYRSWSRLAIWVTTLGGRAPKSYWFAAPTFFWTMEMVLSDVFSPTLVWLVSLKYTLPGCSTVYCPLTIRTVFVSWITASFTFMVNGVLLMMSILAPARASTFDPMWISGSSVSASMNTEPGAAYTLGICTNSTSRSLRTTVIGAPLMPVPLWIRPRADSAWSISSSCTW